MATNLFLPYGMLRGISWLGTNLVRPLGHTVASRDQGVVLHQEMAELNSLSTDVITRASSTTSILSARLTHRQQMLHVMIDKFSLEDTTPETCVRLTPKMSKALPHLCVANTIENSIHTFNLDALNARTLNTWSILDLPTSRTKKVTAPGLYDLYNPLARPRVDLARTNMNVAPIYVDQIPSSLLGSADMSKFLRLISPKVEIRITHDMRHDVIVASWSRLDVDYDLGLRLP